jgi:hypothetical protein
MIPEAYLDRGEPLGGMRSNDTIGVRDRECPRPYARAERLTPDVRLYVT